MLQPMPNWGEEPGESPTDEEEDSEEGVEPIAEVRFVPHDKPAWRQHSLQGLNARLRVQILRMKIQMITEKTII